MMPVRMCQDDEKYSRMYDNDCHNVLSLGEVKINDLYKKQKNENKNKKQKKNK